MNKQSIISMWSGPRNLSTALMYSFENRGDVKIEDEPFYGYFLHNNKIMHPKREMIIKTMECDKNKLINYLTNKKNIKTKQIWYQKQMTHHINIKDDISWIDKVTNCFLIRDPLDVIISYQKIYKKVSMQLTGLEQQKKIFDYVINNIDDKPLVIDANDLRNKPETILKVACKKLNIKFTKKMLQWPKGPKKNEGLWGEDWYKNVWNTNSFIREKKYKKVAIDKDMKNLYAQANLFYNKLYNYKINP